MTKFPALEKAQGELEAARKSLREVFDEGKSKDGLDLDLVKSVSGDKTAKLEWIRGKNTEIEAKAKEVRELTEIHGIAEANSQEFKDTVKTKDDDGPRAVKSIGGEFLKSYKGGSKGQTFALDVETKDLFERTDGWAPEVTRQGRVELQAVQPAVQVTQFVPTAPIDQTSYKYMLESAFTVDADMTAEGGIYHETDLALTETSMPVEKITVWIPVTDEQLQDEPAARAYIDMRLRYMLQRRLDIQVINGNGTSPNLSGTLDQSSINNVVNATTTQPLIDSLGELFLEINTTGFTEPNVAFISPTERDLIRRAKTADGNYLWAHPSQNGPTTVWGVPLVPVFGSDVLPAGTRAVAGDYANYSLLGVKRGIDMQITNTHSTHFVEGKQAIRADMRCVLVHFRPSAFGSITTT